MAVKQNFEKKKICQMFKIFIKHLCHSVLNILGYFLKIFLKRLTRSFARKYSGPHTPFPHKNNGARVPTPDVIDFS
jgi:hypothetical protein